MAGECRIEVQNRPTRILGIEEAADLVRPRGARERIEARRGERRRRRARRPHRARDVRRQPVGEPLVRLYAEAVGQGGQQNVLGAAEDRVDELRDVEAGGELVPGSIAQQRVAVQLVGGAEHQRVPGAPPGIGAFRNPPEIAVAEAEPARLGGQLRPERLGAAKPGDAQSHEELIDGRNHRALAQVGGEGPETAQRRGMPGERPKQVRRPRRLDAERLDAAPDLRRPRSAVSRIHRLDPEPGRVLPRGDGGRRRSGDGGRRRFGDGGRRRFGDGGRRRFGDGGRRRSAAIRGPRGRAAVRGRRPAAHPRRCAIQRDDAGHRPRSSDQRTSPCTGVTSIRHRAPRFVRSSGGRASRPHSRADRGRRDDQVVRAHWQACAAEIDRQSGVNRCGFHIERDDRQRPEPAVRELLRAQPPQPAQPMHAVENLGYGYRRNAERLFARPAQHGVEVQVASLGGDHRARVDQDSHGSPGTSGRLSMATPSATACANSSSSEGPGRDRTIATKSRTVKARRCTGPTSATGVPPRSTTYTARSWRTRSTSAPKFFAASVAVTTRAPTAGRASTEHLPTMSNAVATCEYITKLHTSSNHPFPPAPPAAGHAPDLAPPGAQGVEADGAPANTSRCARAPFSGSMGMVSASESSATDRRMKPCASCESFRPR